MNQVLKERVYMQGSRQWVDYIAALTEMTPTEAQAFRALHRGDTDLTIQTDIGLTKEQYKRIEHSVSSKLKWGLLLCVDYTMQNRKLP